MNHQSKRVIEKPAGNPYSGSSLVPMLVVFFAAQRYFVRSVAATGLKG